MGKSFRSIQSKYDMKSLNIRSYSSKDLKSNVLNKRSLKKSKVSEKCEPISLFHTLQQQVSVGTGMKFDMQDILEDYDLQLSPQLRKRRKEQDRLDAERVCVD